MHLLYKFYRPKEYIPKYKFSIWLNSRFPILAFFHRHICQFPIAKNLNYLYSFGAILTVMLFNQIITGIALAMHYIPQIDLAFKSVEYIRRSVNFGYIFASLHINGASFFFIAAYIHILRAIYYRSYAAPREIVWFFGLLIYFTMLAISFTGYVLRWGMMSTTALTVISNFIEHIPLIGSYLKQLMLGGNCISQNSLSHLYPFHIIAPFILLFLVALHIIAVHAVGQSNPKKLAITTKEQLVSFVPFGAIKDLLAIACFVLIFFTIAFYLPDIFQNNNNYLQGNPDLVSQNIIPEWYFLPFYTMLKSSNCNILGIDSSHIGVIVIFSSFIILFFLPFLDKTANCHRFYKIFYRICFYLFVINMFLLGYLGSLELNELGYKIAHFCILYYFAFFLIIMPLAKKFSNKMNHE